MNKKYGITVVIACVIVVVGVLAFSYSNTNQTNPVVTSQQPNTTNSVTTNPPSTSGRHFFANVNETVIIKSNP